MRAVLITALSLCLAGEAYSVDNPDVMIKVGDPAPTFEAKDHDGKVWNAEEHYGKKVVVIYFYPADLTGGCTKQACGFRDQYAELEKSGVEVIGVSGDSPENHRLFREVHKLNFSLLADEDGKVARTFGVPVREGATITKNIDGVEKTLTRGVTASRWTFVVGLDGKVIHKNTSVNAAEDSKTVLEAIRLLATTGE